jgi:hypothetical protein
VPLGAQVVGVQPVLVQPVLVQPVTVQPVTVQPLTVQPGRVGGGLGAPFHAELGEERRHVVLDRLLGEEQPLADLPVRQPLADQLQDLKLMGG